MDNIKIWEIQVVSKWALGIDFKLKQLKEVLK